MSTEDRRAPGAARIPFDSLVEVGGALGPSFEAQAVNVSEEGMQLRTAYLPELGQQVTCRFESATGQSVITSGEVVWSSGAEQGGEFGIRFTDIDPDSVDALKRVCGVSGSGASGQRGGKVRLYIDGLASPMRAKIRDARPTAITVGSDLGFLQVGKQLELEDAQSGNKRPASIDRVDVAIDPTSQVPQLVVTLRYSDLPANANADAPASAREGAFGASPMPGRGHAVGDAGMHSGPTDDLAALDDASARLKGAFARHAARIGPAFQQFARRAKLTMGLLARRRGVENVAMPRRTTAPPPGGGLHTNGRQVVRGDGVTGPGDVAGGHGKATPTKRKAAIATAVMLCAIIGAVALKRSHQDQPATSASAASAASADTAAPANTAAPAPTNAERVGQSPAAAASQNGTNATEEKTGTSTPARSGSATAEKSAPAAEDSNESTRTPAHKKHARLAPFGNGPVHHGNVLHLKMDGPVESIEGAQQPTGFTVKLPGRKSLEAAGPLTARDSRIAAIKVSNEPTGAELNVTFKDGVPNYQVSAKGETLVIALAPAGPLETLAKRDDKGGKSSKHGARSRDEKDTRPER